MYGGPPKFVLEVGLVWYGTKGGLPHFCVGKLVWVVCDVKVAQCMIVRWSESIYKWSSDLGEKRLVYNVIIL